MLKNKKLIRVRVIFTAANREYECGFSPRSTLKENLNMLKDLISEELNERYLSDGDEIICDETSKYFYDPNVSLASQNITDGTLLMIY
ncbi:MAG: hypothetical protein Q4C20_09295 [Erysipelotrichaceae bacterium]|nr:hypothetical protein [Erysipelotrichaceae bacterium]